VSGKTIAEQLPDLRVTRMWPPSYAERELSIIWNAGAPRGLVVDGVYYAVRPSPGLRHHAGDWRQAIYEAPARP